MILECGAARHGGAHKLAARGDEIETETRLSKDANFPAVQIVERLNEVLRAAAPAAFPRWYVLAAPNSAPCGLCHGFLHLIGTTGVFCVIEREPLELGYTEAGQLY